MQRSGEAATMTGEVVMAEPQPAARYRDPAPASCIECRENVFAFNKENPAETHLTPCKCLTDAPTDRLVTLADVERVVNKTSWHWQQWIPRANVSICVGRPGIGKSVVVLDLIKRALTGGTWPDGTKCPQLKSVMWLDAEGTQAILVERCKTLGIPLDNIVFPFPLGSGSPEEILRDLQLDSPDMQMLKRSLEQHRPGLMVIDSLSGTHHIEEKDSKIGRLIKALQLLARDTDTAILGIHHIRKAGPGAMRSITIDDVRGHGGIAANARVIWCLEPNDLDDPEGKSR